jgi:hypothetical protein
MSDENAAPETTGDPAGTAEATGTETTTETGTTTSTETSAAGTPTTTEAPVYEDWATKRSKYANGDAKLLARLSRYSSEKDAMDALIAAQNRISSGELMSALPENPTPEELQNWRVENGLPATPNDYGVKLPDGTDPITAADFFKTAHDMNMTPAQVSKMVEWRQAIDQKMADDRAEQDRASQNAGEEVLRKDWGSEYKLNINLITGLLDTAPAGVKDQIMGGRLADGTKIGNDPATLRWLASLSREINPMATVVPGSGVNAAQAIENEMQGMQKMMGDPTSEYWKGPKAEAMQQRYRDLLTVQKKVA